MKLWSAGLAAERLNNGSAPELRLRGLRLLSDSRAARLRGTLPAVEILMLFLQERVQGSHVSSWLVSNYRHVTVTEGCGRSSVISGISGHAGNVVLGLPDGCLQSLHALTVGTGWL